MSVIATSAQGRIVRGRIAQDRTAPEKIVRAARPRAMIAVMIVQGVIVLPPHSPFVQVMQPVSAMSLALHAVTAPNSCRAF